MTTIKLVDLVSDTARRVWVFNLVDTRFFIDEYREEERRDDKPRSAFVIKRIWRRASRVYSGEALREPVMPPDEIVAQAHRRLWGLMSYHGADYYGPKIKYRGEKCRSGQ